MDPQESRNMESTWSAVSSSSGSSGLIKTGLILPLAVLYLSKSLVSISLPATFDLINPKNESSSHFLSFPLNLHYPSLGEFMVSAVFGIDREILVIQNIECVLKNAARSIFE
jgi:hypothetical protein